MTPVPVAVASPFGVTWALRKQFVFDIVHLVMNVIRAG